MTSVERHEVNKIMEYHNLKVSHVASNQFEVVNNDRKYRVEIFFDEIDRQYRHDSPKRVYGYMFTATCTCTAGRYEQDCKHALKVFKTLRDNLNLLFPIFDVEAGDFLAIHEKAYCLDAMMADGVKRIAA